MRLHRAENLESCRHLAIRVQFNIISCWLFQILLKVSLGVSSDYVMAALLLHNSPVDTVSANFSKKLIPSMLLR